MKKFIFIGFLLVTHSVFANNISQTPNNLEKQVEVVKQDLVKLESDVEVLLKDAASCVTNNIPSLGTLTVDGIVDACLRQSQNLANAIKHLEKKNPVNGAIVRDFSKAITVLAKMYFNIPVDQTGRIYDRADFYAQLVKVSSKIFGFAALYAVGGMDYSAAIFAINNGGDILSQAVLDSGSQWRKNQSSMSFEEYLIKTYSVANSAFSIPAKGAVSYAMGEVIKRFKLVDAVELFTLVIANQVTINRRADAVNAVWPARLAFGPGFAVSFVSSVVKSLILTTSCKSAVAGVNYYLDTYGFSLPATVSWPTWGNSAENKKEL